MEERQPADKIIKGLTTKADKIRALAHANYDRAEIGKSLGIGYQQVRYVLLRLVLTDSVLMSVPMTCEHRCGHLPQLFRDLVVRLSSSTPICSKESLSAHAALHGVNRRK
jgi:hypothetical protein